MTAWLLDTNVVSELRKTEPAPAVMRWVAGQAETQLHVGAITIAELRCGIARLPQSDVFRTELSAWLDDDLLPWFQGRIVPVTEAILCRWLDLVQRGRAEKRPRLQPDLLLAATAQSRGLGVATRNTADFSWTGIALVDPWQG